MFEIYYTTQFTKFDNDTDKYIKTEQYPASVKKEVRTVLE